MPELAEVAYFQKLWKSALRSKIKKIEVTNSRLFRGAKTKVLAKEISGRTFSDYFQHGKQMLFQFKGSKDSLWLGVHLGMTGELSLQPLSYQKKKHDHLVLITSKNQLVFMDYRMFGRVRFDLGKTFPEWWQQLPLQVFDKKFSYKYFTELLERRGKRPLKAFLLLQECFPGVGNWMADEILWQSKILPSRSGKSLKDKEKKELYKKLLWVCKSAMKLSEPCRWPEPPKTWLCQHRWVKDKNCPRDHTILSRKEIGGRTTCWCSKCQK
jgi:formamidopyrimidine-DNA glycosylase